MKNEEKVRIYREIKLFGDKEPLGFVYDSDYHPIKDNDVCRYSTYKMSLMLTDGLAAVMEGKIYDTVAGDIVFFRPEDIHFGRFLREGIHKFVDFYIPLDFYSRFPSDCSSLIMPFLDTTPERVNHIRLPEKEKEWLLSCLCEMIKTAESEDGARDVVLFSYIVAVLSRFGKWYAEQKNKPETQNTPAFLIKAMKYINNKFTEKIGLTDIAGEIGCSVTYLTKTFRQYTGKTVWGYITECRMRMAEKTLLETGSVTEACYKAGFCDCSDFIKIFRKYHDCTPRQYLLKNNE